MSTRVENYSLAAALATRCRLIKEAVASTWEPVRISLPKCTWEDGGHCWRLFSQFRVRVLGLVLALWLVLVL